MKKISSFDDIYKMNRSKKRRKDMIFKILGAGIILLLAAIVFTIVYLSFMKTAKHEDEEAETESIFDSVEIEEISLDDIPDNCESYKDEQYIKDISDFWPKDVAVAVTKEPYDEKIDTRDGNYEQQVSDIINSAIRTNGTCYKFIDILLSEDLQAFTQDQCSDYDVPYELVLALMESESSFREDIGSEKVLGGEEGGPRYYGYMQLSAENCEKAASTYALDAHTPEGNIEMAVLILSGLLEKYDNDWEKAIMAYKGGEAYADSMIAAGKTSDAAINVTNRACHYGVLLGTREE